MDPGLDRQHFWADLETEGPRKTLWITGLVVGQGKERPKADESTMLWNPTPSDVCLFRKDVIYMCIIYIYNINTDIYLYFPVVRTKVFETELELIGMESFTRIQEALL